MRGSMAATHTPHTAPPVQIPHPRPGGTYAVESLGSVVDTLMGERAIERRAARELGSLLVRDHAADEPPPPEIPEPRPGGTEDITKGGRPPSETR